MKELNEIHVKFVDDLTLAEAVPLKTQLTDKPNRPNSQTITMFALAKN